MPPTVTASQPFGVDLVDGLGWRRRQQGGGPGHHHGKSGEHYLTVVER